MDIVTQRDSLWGKSKLYKFKESYPPFVLSIVNGEFWMNDKLKNVTEENEVMEKKYVFLNLLYHDVLKTAEHYNNQIIGYKDSYGKIYSMVNELNSVYPDEILFHALHIYEDVLSNSTVSLYVQENESLFRAAMPADL